MSEIVLQIHDDTDFERIVALLAPFIKKAEMKATGKIWNGKAEWLNHPVKTSGFTPLSREEAHER
ncbi:MAG: hypothetical protein LBT00_10410 [Spirochaetaceae bacterium]|jgi:hypothetical protein|nr:hypothetical protein [Spirochaetaceae bacterium]